MMGSAADAVPVLKACGEEEEEVAMSYFEFIVSGTVRWSWE
jgi:hypothetical protein